jgi:pimeloyl-ACP methyl ester carboxylesterase
MSSYLLVHGAWCGGWIWDDLVTQLEKSGHDVTVVEQLPSAGIDPASLGDLTADAAHLRQVLDEVDEPVVLVGHSYGGTVITEMADHPKVRHSVYLAAFWPQRGQSQFDILGAGPLPAWIFPSDDGSMALTEDHEVMCEVLCADMDQERAAVFVSRLVLESVSSHATPSTAPDRGHPTTYVICEHDNALPVSLQEAMSANADHVVRLPAGHMAQLSHPEELAEALGRI